MRKVVYSGNVSLDGYFEDRDGDFSWSVPDEEIHHYWTGVMRETGASLMGRRMYETMEPFWTETAAKPTGKAYIDDFARAWVATPRFVFSRTLDSVSDGLTLVTGDTEAEVRRIKEMPGGDIDVGGPGLANSLAELGLIDELRILFQPVAVGGGKPFLGPAFDGTELDLIETDRFSSGVLLTRYAIRRP